MSKNKSIIVKKVIKKGGGGHHGGAWKVAYADFVTAMMAFFLLMWLLNMTSEEKRVRLSTYFKYFSIYDQGGTSFMEKSSDIFSEAGENKQKVFDEKQGTTIDNADTATMAPENVGAALEKDIAKKLGDLKDQVLIDTTDEGTRIQMIDKEGSLMFEQGNNKLTPKAKEVLKLISENLRNYSNKIIIEGHTDALPYTGSQYSNWELSTERASSARKALEAAGFDPNRITRVAGYADTDPLIKDNPHDPRNRRISITLSSTQKYKPKTPDVQGETKQLKKASKELISIIDNNQISAGNDHEKSRAAEGSNKKDKNNAVIKSQAGPASSPVKESSNGKNSSAVIKQNDYDSIIMKGQSNLETGNKQTTSKNKTESNTKNSNQPSAIKGQANLKTENKQTTSKNKTESNTKNSNQPSAIKGTSNKDAVITELSQPVIIKENFFSLTPPGK